MDLVLSYGLLTNMSDVGFAGDFVIRQGARVVYFRQSLGVDYINTSRVEKKVPNTDYWWPNYKLGLGFAIRPTRSMSIYPELGSYLGILFKVHNTRSEPSIDGALGGFLGVATDYRPSGWAWGVGVNYLMQTIHYDGFDFKDVDLGHIFSFAFTYHREGSRAD